MGYDCHEAANDLEPDAAEPNQQGHEQGSDPTNGKAGASNGNGKTSNKSRMWTELKHRTQKLRVNK